jgi:hypothetical protein
MRRPVLGSVLGVVWLAVSSAPTAAVAVPLAQWLGPWEVSLQERDVRESASASRAFGLFTPEGRLRTRAPRASFYR